MRCPSCSTKVAPTDKTCPSCGSKLRTPVRGGEEESWRSRAAAIAAVVALVGVIVGMLVLRSDRDPVASPSPSASAPTFTEGYPSCASEIEVPESVEPVNGTEASQGFCVATMSTSLEPARVAAAYEAVLTAGGFEVIHDSRDAEVGTPDLVQLQAIEGDRCVSLTVTPGVDGEGRRVTLVLGPAETLCPPRPAPGETREP